MKPESAERSAFYFPNIRKDCSGPARVVAESRAANRTAPLPLQFEPEKARAAWARMAPRFPLEGLHLGWVPPQDVRAWKGPSAHFAGLLAIADHMLGGFDLQRLGGPRDIWASGELDSQGLRLMRADQIIEKIELFLKLNRDNSRAVFFVPQEAALEYESARGGEEGALRLLSFNAGAMKALPPGPVLISVRPDELIELIDWLARGKLGRNRVKALAPWILSAAALAAVAFFTSLVIRRLPTCDVERNMMSRGPRRSATEARPALLFVPPGTVCIGSEEHEVGRYINEPVHPVRLTEGFWIAATETTQAQWRTVMGSNPSRFSRLPNSDQRPVERVNWFEAIAYVNRLSELEELDKCYDVECEGSDLGHGCENETSALSIRPCDGEYRCSRVSRRAGCRGYRLPSEAEWEYAARAGTQRALGTEDIEIEGDVRTSRNAPAISRFGWYGGNSLVVGDGEACEWPDVEISVDRNRCATQPVAGKEPNALGLYDVVGNVWEWVEDGYDQRYGLEDLRSITANPTGPSWSTVPLLVVHRGGAYRSFASVCRMSARDGFEPIHRNPGLGFRIAQTN